MHQGHEIGKFFFALEHWTSLDTVFYLLIPKAGYRPNQKENGGPVIDGNSRKTPVVRESVDTGDIKAMVELAVKQLRL